jgi:hypothetical protein
MISWYYNSPYWISQLSKWILCTFLTCPVTLVGAFGSFIAASADLATSGENSIICEELLASTAPAGLIAFAHETQIRYTDSDSQSSKMTVKKDHTGDLEIAATPAPSTSHAQPGAERSFAIGIVVLPQARGVYKDLSQSFGLML